ncbi:MAG: hypothetical protein Q9187_002003 [Circinaria calcarea]
MVQAGQSESGIPYIYYATGLFPNQILGKGSDFFAVVGLGGDASIAVLAAKRYEGRSVILVTAGSDYLILNGTQCEINLVPKVFNVDVDVVNKLISVLPMTTIAGSPSLSFDPTAGLANTVIDQLNNVGMISTSLYTSIVGDTFMFNIAAATTSNITPSSSAATFAAIEDSFSAILDDLLLFVGSSQFFIPDAGAGDFSTADVHLTVQAVRLGEAKYVFAIFATCVVLLTAVATEACRTRAWRWLPKWDFSDTTSLVIASAVAGEDVVSEMCRNVGAGGGQMEWTGGGSGGLRQERGQEAREDWGDGGQKELPDIYLRLGRKAVGVTQQVQDGNRHRNGNGEWDGDGDGNRNGNRNGEVQLVAVSLWTSDAKDIMPLI